MDSSEDRSHSFEKMVPSPSLKSKYLPNIIDTSKLPLNINSPSYIAQFTYVKEPKDSRPILNQATTLRDELEAFNYISTN